MYGQVADHVIVSPNGIPQVRSEFKDRPEVYDEFLDVMKMFKSQKMTAPDVIQSVSSLFRGHTQLMQVGAFCHTWTP